MAKGKRKKKVRLKIKNIIILLLIVSFVGLMLYCFIRMPINNIYVNGNKILNDEEILEMVNIDSYPSFVLTDRFKMKKILLSNDYVCDVKIKKKLGNIIEIDILECEVIATDVSGKVILSNGNVLNNIYDITDVPLLTNEIGNNNVYNLFVNKMSEIDNNVLRQISEIEYSPVSVDESRFLFYMNDGNLVHVTLTKLEKINKYNKIKDTLEGRKGIIYLDSGDYVEFIN